MEAVAAEFELMHGSGFARAFIEDYCRAKNAELEKLLNSCVCTALGNACVKECSWISSE
jgi:hypothetical protein